MTNYEIIQEMKRLKNEAYGILGLTPTASLAEVDSAYASLAFELHPNRHSNDPHAFARFAKLCHAKEIIQGGNAAFQRQAVNNLMQQEEFAKQQPQKTASVYPQVNPQYDMPPPLNPEYTQQQDVNGYLNGAYQDYHQAFMQPATAPEMEETTTTKPAKQQAQDANFSDDTQHRKAAEKSISPEEDAQRMMFMFYMLRLVLDVLKKALELYVLMQANTVIVSNRNNYYYDSPRYYEPRLFTEPRPLFECHYSYRTTFVI